MSFSALEEMSEEFSLEGYEPEEVIETADGLKMAIYYIGDRGSFLDLDWKPESKWEFLDTVEPELLLDAVIKELFGNEEGEQILEGLFGNENEDQVEPLACGEGDQWERWGDGA